MAQRALYPSGLQCVSASLRSLVRAPSSCGSSGHSQECTCLLVSCSCFGFLAGLHLQSPFTLTLARPCQLPPPGYEPTSTAGAPIQEALEAEQCAILQALPNSGVVWVPEHKQAVKTGLSNWNSTSTAECFRDICMRHLHLYAISYLISC